MNTILEIPKLPSTVVLDPPLTDEEFEKLCAGNHQVRLERTKEGTIVVNPPTAGFTGGGNAEITYQLVSWWDTHERGRPYDSNTGFFLPDGSMLCPDAAYLCREKSLQISKNDGGHFLRFCPDFVVELLSATDDLDSLKNKMQHWIANGASLGWLIDPHERQVYVYRPTETVRVETGLRLAGEYPVEGFVLNLAKVWRHYEEER